MVIKAGGTQEHWAGEREPIQLPPWKRRAGWGRGAGRQHQVAFPGEGSQGGQISSGHEDLVRQNSAQVKPGSHLPGGWGAH